VNPASGQYRLPRWRSRITSSPRFKLKMCL
jgi:hypothetical protein